MKRFLMGGSLLLVLVVAACSSTSSGGGLGSPDGGAPNGDDLGDDGSGVGSASCSSDLSSGFTATPTSFSIPAARCQSQFNASASAGTTDYAVIDLVSNDRPDLTVFSDQCDSTVGSTHWDIYPWSASGYPATPTAFSIPAARCQDSFSTPQTRDDVLHYSLISLQTKQHPDLVVFGDHCDDTVGDTHWDIYPWAASGFPATPTAFSVPAARCQQRFNNAAAQSSINYALLNLVTNAHPDLVVFNDTCDATVGTTHWDVYPWAASGFPATPTSFSVPAARCQTPFNNSAGESAVHYSLLDLTADGHADLVVFADNCDHTVGTDHWDVYPWSASGFAATPTAFAIPAARCNAPFDDASGSTNVSYSVVALTGSLKPDLVVSKDSCDDSVGRDHWDVYRWGASGFSKTPTSFAVPAARCQSKFDELAGTNAVTFDLLKLAGDCKPSLVVHSDSCDTTVGATRWDLYNQK